MGRMVVSCGVIQDDLDKHIPKGWKILKAVEISLPYSEEDPEGCTSKFAIAFEDQHGELKLGVFTHSYHGGSLDLDCNSYYDSGGV